MYTLEISDESLKKLEKIGKEFSGMDNKIVKEALRKALNYAKKEVVRKWYPDTSEDEELQYFSRPLCIPNKDVKSWFIATVI